MSDQGQPSHAGSNLVEEDMLGKPPPQSEDEAPLHACEVEFVFPHSRQATWAKQVLEVDPEPTDRVAKALFLVPVGPDSEEVKMVVRFHTKELKMLRVAVSSFCDYVVLVCQTMMQFDPELKTNGDTK